MLICAAQYNVVFGDKAANMLTCKRLCLQAKQKGAQMVVFPELSLTGFCLDKSLAEADNGETVGFFKQCAVEFDIAIVFGYAEIRGECIYNTLAAVSPDGVIMAGYSKIHPFSYGKEHEHFAAGDRISYFRCGGLSIGLSICYDLRFPELYSALAEHCDCAIVSANWGAARAQHWDTLLKARAIEDQMYVVGCNCVCSVGMICSGGSAIIAPDGTELQHAVSDEALLCAEISAEKVHNIRSAFPQRNDRRPDIYRNFYE